MSLEQACAYNNACMYTHEVLATLKTRNLGLPLLSAL